MSGAREFAFRPVIIIGAGRSGTNILRDCLTRLPGLATWPCDEINPIWRHGNIAVDHDAFDRSHARPDVVRSIRQAFVRQWRASGEPSHLVEKTCANTLRVPFVDAVLPEAMFIHIVRDGRDVVASAAKRWQGDLEVPSIPYYWSKLRFVPWTDLPVYGWRFVRGRIAMLTGRSTRLAFWGPRSRAMAELPSDTPLDELCARQWSDCVTAADAALSALPGDRVIEIRYEDLVTDPADVVRTIVARLGLASDPQHIAQAVAPVRRSSVGKGAKAALGFSSRVRALLAPGLARHGYQQDGVS